MGCPDQGVDWVNMVSSKKILDFLGNAATLLVAAATLLVAVLAIQATPVHANTYTGIYWYGNINGVSNYLPNSSVTVKVWSLDAVKAGNFTYSTLCAQNTTTFSGGINYGYINWSNTSPCVDYGYGIVTSAPTNGSTVTYEPFNFVYNFSQDGGIISFVLYSNQSQYTIQAKDTLNRVVPNTLIYFYDSTSAGYHVCLTDITGTCSIYLTDGGLYRIVGTADGYDNFTGTINPSPSQNPYVITLSPSNNAFVPDPGYYVQYGVQTGENSSDYNITLNMISGLGYLEYWGMEAVAPTNIVNTIVPTTTYCSAVYPGIYACASSNDSDWSTFATTSSPGIGYIYKNYSSYSQDSTLIVETGTDANVAGGYVTPSCYNYTSSAWHDFSTLTNYAVDNSSFAVPLDCLSSSPLQLKFAIGSTSSSFGELYETQLNYTNESVTQSFNSTNSTGGNATLTFPIAYSESNNTVTINFFYKATGYPLQEWTEYYTFYGYQDNSSSIMGGLFGGSNVPVNEMGRSVIALILVAICIVAGISASGDVTVGTLAGIFATLLMMEVGMYSVVGGVLTLVGVGLILAGDWVGR